MSNIPDVLFPIDDHLMRLEPVVFLESGVYVKTRGANEGALFVTARGVAHRLRQFMTRDVFNEHFVKRNAPLVRKHLQTELERLRVGGHADELRYFVEHLLPSFVERDWSASFPHEVTPDVISTYGPSDLSSLIESLSHRVPAAFLPAPSVLILGRFRSLRPAATPSP